ncbi:MAG: long-chain fatty acid--CoA ligase [Spirochaetes bacterium]|nr:long-chain fatty acid--CoA ligase [Spirochaetota bacterium]
MSTGSYTENTMAGIFRNRVSSHGSRQCFRYRAGTEWKGYTYAETKELVDALASYLINSGINPGDNIAIYSTNRPEWGIADLASLSVGAADVTVYPTNSAPEAAYILKDSNAKVCLCAGKFQVENLLQEKSGLPSLQRIIVFDDLDFADPMVVRFTEAVAQGRANNRESEIDKRIRGINPDDIMTLIYTSGTTGNPKGVMLTHNNMVSNVLQFFEHHPFPEDFDAVALSLLPLSHSLERTIGYNSMLYWGATAAYAKGADTLLEDLRDIRPTCCVYVPRVLEKLYEGVMSKLKDAPASKKMIFSWALKTGKKAIPYILSSSPMPFPLGMKYRYADKLVFSKLREALGLDRNKVIGIGGAPLSVEIYEFFEIMGLEIHLGFGLTETSPVTHLNTFSYIKRIKMDTSGPALPRTECRIAEDGEVLVRGPQVMKGYYNRPEDTKEVFTDDGWFKTGDIGIIDEDGYLKITDRKKDIIVTAGGKNVAPQVIEGMFIQHPLIEQIAVIGDMRKYLVALIVPGFPELARWAKSKGIVETDPEKLVKLPEVVAQYQKAVDELNRPLGRVEQIKRFAILGHPFTQETGELTPTLKVKRKAVFKKYQDLIESMYVE